MRIAPLAPIAPPAAAPTVRAAIALTMPPDPERPTSDLRRFEKAIEFTSLVQTEVQTSVMRLHDAGMAAAAQWANFAEINTGQIFDQLQHVARLANSPVLEQAHATADAAAVFAAEARAGRNADTFDVRAGQLLVQVRALAVAIAAIRDAQPQR